VAVLLAIYPKIMTTKKPLALREWRYPRTYRTIFAKEPRGIFQTDVMELHPLWKHIFHEYERDILYRPKDYALVCIDVFSRYVWAVAMDKQDSPSTAAAMLKIFVHMGIPKILQGDQKIINSFQKELSPYFPGITLIASKPNETNKNAIVERVIRTLKNDLLQYLYFHPFPEKSERFVVEEEYYFQLDTTTMILQEICTLRNNTIHRTIRQKPIDVFYGRAPNRQIIARKKYSQFNLGDLIMAKPIRERGELGVKTLHFDHDIYIIVLKEGDKYKLKSLYNFIRGKKDEKPHWYKPYEIRKITPQQALEHLKSPLVWEYLYRVYETPDAIEDMRKYLQHLL
jgi:transposase InsO family protein